MLITYKDGTIPTPNNQFSDAPAFGSGNEVVVEGQNGRIKRIANDKSWLDIQFSGWAKRLHWDKTRQEYFGRKMQ